MNINKLRIHCSHISHILSTAKDNRPITDRQMEEMKRLIEKEQLTDAQMQKLKYYVQKETNYNPKELSKSAKADLVRMYAWGKYRKCQVTGVLESMALEKGTIAESESIKLLSELDGIKYKKNKRTYRNDFLIGKPDIVIKNPKLKVIDIKTSVDIVSFLSRIEKTLNYDYIMQMQGYLELVDAPMGEVVHCLVNMPPEIIEKEMRMRKQRCFLFGKSDEDTAASLEILNNSMIFDDIPIKKRVLRIKVYRDQSKMKDVYVKVEVAREWLKRFHRKHIFAKFE